MIERPAGRRPQLMRHQRRTVVAASRLTARTMLLTLSLLTPPPPLSVLTYNVYSGPPTQTRLAGTLDGSSRLAQQVEQIKRLKPDIICLQEVISDGVRTYFDEQLRDEYQSSFVLTSEEIRCKFGRMLRTALDHIGPQTTISGFIWGATQSGLM